MTRVNVISPLCLYDQHLVAEYREISRIPSAIIKLLKTKGTYDILKDLPLEYTFGAGHVRFFYDKLLYIKNRHDSLKEEGILRGITLTSITIDLSGIPKPFLNDYSPTEEAIGLNLERIKAKIDMKPTFYRYYRGKK